MIFISCWLLRAGCWYCCCVNECLSNADKKKVCCHQFWQQRTRALSTNSTKWLANGMTLIKLQNNLEVIKNICHFFSASKFVVSFQHINAFSCVFSWKGVFRHRFVVVRLFIFVICVFSPFYLFCVCFNLRYKNDSTKITPFFVFRQWTMRENSKRKR